MPPPFAQEQKPQEVTMAAAVGSSQPQAREEVAHSGAPIMKIGGASTYQPSHGRNPQQGDGGHKFTLQQLRATDAMIPSQYGTNQFASQQGMTGFGTPRNTSTSVYTSNPNLPPTTFAADENPHRRYGKFTLEQLKATDAFVRPQSGTNQFATQKGMAIGSSRDVRGKHLHRIWDGLFDEEIAAEQAQLQQQQQQQQHDN